jgi:hypothetical protein
MNEASFSTVTPADDGLRLRDWLIAEARLASNDRKEVVAR